MNKMPYAKILRVAADPVCQDGVKCPYGSSDESKQISERFCLEFRRGKAEHADACHGNGESHEVHHPQLFFAAGHRIGEKNREKRRDGRDDAYVRCRRMSQSDIFQQIVQGDP